MIDKPTNNIDFSIEENEIRDIVSNEILSLFPYGKLDIYCIAWEKLLLQDNVWFNLFQREKCSSGKWADFEKTIGSTIKRIDKLNYYYKDKLPRRKAKKYFPEE